MTTKRDGEMVTAIDAALTDGPQTAMSPDQFHSMLADADLTWKTMLEWLRDNLKKDIDYGVVPGTQKPSLWQPGAEKICGRLGWTKTHPDAEKWVDRAIEGALSLPEILNRVILFNSAGKRVGEGVGAYPVEMEINEYKWTGDQNNRKKEKVGTKLERDVNKALQMSIKRAHVAAVKSTAGLSAVFTMNLAEETAETGSLRDHEVEEQYFRAKVGEMYGDQAEAVLERFAKQRFRLDDWRDIPMLHVRFALNQLKSKARNNEAIEA